MSKKDNIYIRKKHIWWQVTCVILVMSHALLTVMLNRISIVFNINIFFQDNLIDITGNIYLHLSALLYSSDS